MDLVIKAVDLICYSWYKYCLGPAPDLMSLTDWCFVMDQHTLAQDAEVLRWALSLSPAAMTRPGSWTLWELPAARAATISDPLNQKWGHLDHQCDPITWPAPPSWVVISGLEMWQHRVCIERERRHSKDWHLGCLTHSADGGKLGTVHWLNIHYTESGNTITRNIQPIPHLPVSHSYKMTEYYYTRPRIKERILKIKLTNTLWCDEKWKESGMFV